MKDVIWKTKVDAWERDAILNLLEKTENYFLRTSILPYHKRLEKQEISEKLELEVGVNLQYIHFNVTLAGCIMDFCINGI